MDIGELTTGRIGSVLSMFQYTFSRYLDHGSMFAFHFDFAGLAGVIPIWVVGFFFFLLALGIFLGHSLSLFFLFSKRTEYEEMREKVKIQGWSVSFRRRREKDSLE